MRIAHLRRGEIGRENLNLDEILDPPACIHIWARKPAVPHAVPLPQRLRLRTRCGRRQGGEQRAPASTRDWGRCRGDGICHITLSGSHRTLRANDFLDISVRSSASYMDKVASQAARSGGRATMTYVLACRAVNADSDMADGRADGMSDGMGRDGPWKAHGSFSENS